MTCPRRRPGAAGSTRTRSSRTGRRRRPRASGPRSGRAPRRRGPRWTNVKVGLRDAPPPLEVGHALVETVAQTGKTWTYAKAPVPQIKGNRALYLRCTPRTEHSGNGAREAYVLLVRCNSRLRATCHRCAWACRNLSRTTPCGPSSGLTTCRFHSSGCLLESLPKSFVFIVPPGRSHYKENANSFSLFRLARRKSLWGIHLTATDVVCPIGHSRGA